MTRFASWLIASTICCLGLTGCGGGGGGGDSSFVGAALVSLRTEPSKIDSGDRTRVQVDISEAHPNGIALKLRFPKGLAYVRHTAVLEADGIDPLPVNPQDSKSKDDTSYVVFYFSRAKFGDNNQATLTLQLEGVTEVKDGLIEVDADIDDPRTDNSTEFKIDSPEFTAVDSADIEVVG